MLWRYPKLTFIALTYVAAFGAFAFVGPDAAHALVEPLGIGGVFVAGALYTYGFTASLGAVLLIAFTPIHSPIVVTIIGALGATVADLTIFRFVRGSLKREVASILNYKSMRPLVHSPIFRAKAVRNILGFFFIASPLPDEIGVALISMTRMPESTFRIIDFAANLVGIYLITAAAGLTL